MLEIVQITKALAEENRVRAVLALQEQELCVCQLIELLGLAPSTVSKHMQILRQAGLVTSRKRGRWVYYGAAGEEASAAVRQALAWIREGVAAEGRIREDAARLQEILAMDPEELCRIQQHPTEAGRRSSEPTGKETL